MESPGVVESDAPSNKKRQMAPTSLPVAAPKKPRAVPIEAPAEPKVARVVEDTVTAARSATVVSEPPQQLESPSHLWFCIDYPTPKPFAAASLVLTNDSTAPGPLLVERLKTYDKKFDANKLTYHELDRTVGRAFWLQQSDVEATFTQPVCETIAYTTPQRVFLWLRGESVMPCGLAGIAVADCAKNAKLLMRQHTERGKLKYDLESFSFVEVEFTPATMNRVSILEFGDVPATKSDASL